MSGIAETVASGSLLLAMLVAFAAGVLSFVSPCVLPLAPGYLSYMTGLTGAELEEGATGKRSRVLLGSVLFVVGFSVVFVSYGVLFGGLGSLLLQYQDIVNRVLGVLVIVMGLAFMGAIPGLQREWRIHRMPAYSVWGAPLLGILFGLGWTPCIGPTLTAILSLSLQSASPGRGALLGLIYCIGLGIPFVLLALGFEWATTSVTFLKRHIRTINIVGGVLLVIIGLLMVSGLWTVWVYNLQAVIGSFVPSL